MCQIQWSRSNFSHAAVDIRGSALPTAAKSNERVIASLRCVSVNQWMYADNCEDAVDQLLIYLCACTYVLTPSDNDVDGYHAWLQYIMNASLLSTAKRGR